MYYALSPLSFLYGIGVRVRNFLFDKGLIQEKTYPIPIISIGNLSVGGTGKTPHTEYLIKLLKDKYRVAVLSRGYKRKSKGFVIATAESNSRDIGDEPFQIKTKFPEVEVAVDSDRRNGIKHLLSLPGSRRPEVILLDDAFQHRYVKPSLSILLTDYKRPFYNDSLLPGGRLREPAKGALRADLIIMTKCDKDLNTETIHMLESKMKVCEDQKAFFTTVVYDDLKAVFPSEAESLSKEAITPDMNVMLIAGIASPEPFVKEMRRYSDNVTEILFSDHHNFDATDMRKLYDKYKKISGERCIVVTTEKDASRLKDHPSLPDAWRRDLYYLPIKVEFLENSDFDKEIEQHIISFSINNTKR